MADIKNESDKTPSNQNKGSGSDTASAAKISAGTSVGNVGQSPMPQAQTGSGAGSAGSSTPGQSSTLASHTSKPLGGQTATKDNAATAGRQGAASSSRSDVGKSSAQTTARSGQQGGLADTARHTADQATDWARETYERASSWATDAYEGASGTIGHARARSTGSLAGTRRGVQNYVSQNPVMVGLVGLAAGLLIGALLPRTRREDEVFGEWADEVRRQGLRYAQDMTERGRDYVEEAFSGDEAQFSRHESEFGGSAGQRDQNVPGQH